jgi:biotin synthase
MTTQTTPNLKTKISQIYLKPLPDLLFEAQTVHRQYHDPNEVQFCTLSNIKSGACPEDCGYCSQSARHSTEAEVYGLLDIKTILAEANTAKENGSTRFCMGAAWRQAPNNEQFEQVLELVREVKALNMEPCVTLGMLSGDQAARLKEAGLHSYNHNLDTSPEYYPKIITTRTFQDRLDTISQVQEAGIHVCTGGIMGMGETREDRISFLESIAQLNPAPSSVPINMLVAVPGTPVYEDALDNPIDGIEFVRTIATARILVPEAQVRLSAGRLEMTDEMQALCFMAGANSIFTGDKLLTTGNPGDLADRKLVIDKLGMHVRQA